MHNCYYWNIGESSKPYVHIYMYIQHIDYFYWIVTVDAKFRNIALYFTYSSSYRNRNISTNLYQFLARFCILSHITLDSNFHGMNKLLALYRLRIHADKPKNVA